MNTSQLVSRLEDMTNQLQVNSASSAEADGLRSQIKQLKSQLEKETLSASASSVTFRALNDDLGALLENPAEGTVAKLQGPRAVLVDDPQATSVILHLACRSSNHLSSFFFLFFISSFLLVI